MVKIVKTLYFRIVPLTFLIALLSPNSYCQSRQLLNDVALYYNINRLYYQQKFDSVIVLGKKISEDKVLNCYDVNGFIAQAYFKKKLYREGLQRLTWAVENQDYDEVDNVKYNFREFHLDSVKAYKYILDNFETIHSRNAKNLNYHVIEKCHEIFFTDQRTRNIWLSIHDSTEKKYAYDVMWKSDSINILEMKQLLKELRHIPGIHELGKSFTAHFNYVLTHISGYLDRDSLYVYLKQSTLAGEIPNWYGPRILDKLEYNKGKPLIYGVFGNSSDYDDDGTYIYPALQNIDEIDKRRREFLLLPLYKQQEIEKSKLPGNYNLLRQK